jgi:hypothetical protein
VADTAVAQIPHIRQLLVAAGVNPILRPCEVRELTWEAQSLAQPKGRILLNVEGLERTKHER